MPVKDYKQLHSLEIILRGKGHTPSLVWRAQPYFLLAGIIPYPPYINHNGQKVGDRTPNYHPHTSLCLKMHAWERGWGERYTLVNAIPVRLSCWFEWHCKSIALSAFTSCSPHTFSKCHLVTPQPLKGEMPFGQNNFVVTKMRPMKKQYQPKFWLHKLAVCSFSRSRSDCHKDTGGCIACIAPYMEARWLQRS